VIYIKKIKSKLSLITSAIALSGLSAMTFAPIVIAQEPAADEDMEKISIIGSRRLGRSIEDSPVPIDVIDADSIMNTGLTETNQILGTLLPSFNFPQPSITDGTDHVRPAQLRGLAPDHTLVLINGKRRHSSALLNLNGSSGRGSSAVDMNAIPANAIKRIEVLRDGAAAQYGSDAIAGVINIVLKNADSGGSASVTYGANATSMDGVADLKSVGIGTDGNLAFTEGSDRNVTDGQTLTVRANSGFALGEDGFVNVSLEFRDRHAANRADYDKRENYARLNDGSLDPRELTANRYNHTFGNGNVEDFALFVNSGYYLNEDAELYAFGSYSKREGEGGGFYRRASDSRNVQSIYPDGFLPVITSNIADYSLATGLRGAFKDLNYDVSAVYGKDEFSFGVINSLNTSFGPTSQTEFDAGTLTYDQLTLNADFSQLVDVDMFENSLNIAFGFEYRSEGYNIEAGESASYERGTFGRGGAVTDPINGPFGSAGSQVFPGFTPSATGDNSRHNVSAYIDLEADITAIWNLTVAARIEDYSDFGSTVSGKIANRVELSEELALRFSASTGFRAPSLQQQYFTSISTVFVDAVPTETGTFSPNSDVAKALGSPGLDAEDSVSFGGGLTWTPLTEFSLSVDYYHIDIEDRIVLSNNLSGSEVEALLAGTGANRARFFLNAIDSTTKGVDVVATYSMDMEEVGNLLLNVGFNYNKNEVTDIIEPPAILQGAGFDQGNLFSGNELRRFEVGSPKSKLNLSAAWSKDSWNATLRTTRYGETQDPSDNPERNEILPEKWVTDLDVNYAVTDNIKFTLGSNNIFDVYPDTTRELVEDVTTFSRLFSYSGFSPFGFTGRYVYGKVSITF
jgi:iron complex outermembrane receptor protein